MARFTAGLFCCRSHGSLYLTPEGLSWRSHPWLSIAWSIQPIGDCQATAEAVRLPVIGLRIETLRLEVASCAQSRALPYSLASFCCHQASPLVPNRTQTNNLAITAQREVQPMPTL